MQEIRIREIKPDEDVLLPFLDFLQEYKNGMVAITPTTNFIINIKPCGVLPVFL